mgnify:CR=1 FL=1
MTIITRSRTAETVEVHPAAMAGAAEAMEDPAVQKEDPEGDQKQSDLDRFRFLPLI